MKNNKKHILDNPISENKKDKHKEKDKNDLENYFLKQKRKVLRMKIFANIAKLKLILKQILIIILMKIK